MAEVKARDGHARVEQGFALFDGACARPEGADNMRSLRESLRELGCCSRRVNVLPVDDARLAKSARSGHLRRRVVSFGYVHGV